MVECIAKRVKTRDIFQILQSSYTSVWLSKFHLIPKPQPYKVATPERFICTVLKINHGRLVITFDCNSAKTQYLYNRASHELRNANKLISKV